MDKQTLFEHARKNLYCSRCNGLLLEMFLQIVTHGKSLQQEGAGAYLSCSKSGVMNIQSNGLLNTPNGSQDEAQDLSVHPWGGLTTTRDGTLTLLDCYLYSKPLEGLQNVFDSARARERERILLYPHACGTGERGWISSGITPYGRVHATRESCPLHTARLSCDTLMDFWSALVEETRQSLFRMKEENFTERLMYRENLQLPSSPFSPGYIAGQWPPPQEQERFQSVIGQLFQHVRINAQRIIRCGGAVDDDMANFIVAQLLYLDVIDPTKVYTLISEFGQYPTFT